MVVLVSRWLSQHQCTKSISKTIQLKQCKCIQWQVLKGEWGRRILTRISGWNSMIEHRFRVWAQSLVLFPLSLGSSELWSYNYPWTSLCNVIGREVFCLNKGCFLVAKSTTCMMNFLWCTNYRKQWDYFLVTSPMVQTKEYGEGLKTQTNTTWLWHTLTTHNDCSTVTWVAM